MRQTWKGINELLGGMRKKGKTKNINFIRSNENAALTNDPKTIGNTLNEYFATVGDKLASAIPEVSVKTSRTEKMKKYFTRIGVSIWNSIPLSLKSLNKSAYQNKIKKLLLDVLNCEDDYIEVSKLIKHFATLT